jgi:CHAT domain-containing protein
MEPSRQQAYLALIQQLLQCPSGEEPAVLESHQDLLDVEFLAMCEQVAQMLEEQEDQNSALWLRNLATQLGEVIAAGGSGGGAEQQGAFLMQLLRAIDESQSDPQVVYSLLRVNLPQLNSGVVALLDQWWEGVLTGADREQQQGLAGVVGNFGNLVAQFPLGNPGLNKQIAIAAYANALRVYTEAELPQAWASTNNNLGNAYCELAPFSANPREQIENAIAAFRNALRVYTEAEQPQDWATTNNNLGNAYRELAPFSANPREQIENAIADFRNALRVSTEAEQPQDYAMTNNNLGNAYRELAPFSANPREQIENAIAALRNALRVYSEAEQPEAWATTNNSLGNAYRDLSPFSANPREQIENAIAAFRNALRVSTEAEQPQGWATANNNLGNAYRELAPFSANPREQIENAIANYRNALLVFTEAEQPEAWATTNNNLGNAYSVLAPFSANPREQIENAIVAHRSALRVRTEAVQPQDYAMSNNNLGIAYRELAAFSANPREQIENAIAAYRNGLRVYTEVEQPQAWADTNNNLGLAYSDLAPFSTNPREQIENAIVAHRSALRVRTEAVQPQDYAMSNNNLGIAYRDLAPFSANPREQIENAIAAYRNALRVFTEVEQPQDYAMLNNNLGIAYRELAAFSDNPREQIENAIAAYRTALRAFTQAEQPEAWASTNNNLGNAYSVLAPFSANPREQIENAIASYRNALRVRDPVQRPANCLQTARNLGNLGFTNKRPDVAIDGFLLAITAVENLRSAAIDPARKAEIVSEAIEVYANLVQVYVDQQNYAQALEVVDRSKARNLVELLSSKDLYPKGEIPPEVIQRLDELRGSIARAERELNRAQPSGDLARPPMAGSEGIAGPEGARSLAFERIQQQQAQKVGKRLLQLKQELDHLIQDQIQPIDPSFSLSQKVQPLSIEQLRATLPDGHTVIVSWYVAGPQLLAFILHRGALQPICHRYPEPTLEALMAEMNAYLSAYRSENNSWQAGLAAALDRFSRLLELDALLEKIQHVAPGADQLILVPHRFLHLLPLHCLPFGKPTTTLLDQFSRGVRFAPSLQVLDVVQKRPQTPLQSLFALQNPTEDLLYTDLEVAEIQALFAPNAKVLQRQEATKAALEQQSALLASSNCLHYACHGYFNFEKPELSALILAGSAIEPALPDADANRYLRQRDGSALDLNKCLTLLDLFALDLRQARLVALSACETGLSELNSLSDEFVGLSSGFLYAGCNSVIGTLWTVNDLSTGLLMAEFYRLLKQQEQTQPSTDVALALKQAQQWLRQLTCAEAVATLQRLVPSLDADGQETAKRNIRRSLSERYAADDRPYHHPFYWAAFCAVGQ